MHGLCKEISQYLNVTTPLTVGRVARILTLPMFCPKPSRTNPISSLSASAIFIAFSATGCVPSMPTSLAARSSELPMRSRLLLWTCSVSSRRSLPRCSALSFPRFLFVPWIPRLQVPSSSRSAHCQLTAGRKLMACLRRKGWLHDEVDALDSHTRCRRSTPESQKQSGGITFRYVEDGMKGTEECAVSLRTEPPRCETRRCEESSEVRVN